MCFSKHWVLRLSCEIALFFVAKPCINSGKFCVFSSILVKIICLINYGANVMQTNEIIKCASVRKKLLHLEQNYEL